MEVQATETTIFNFSAANFCNLTSVYLGEPLMAQWRGQKQIRNWHTAGCRGQTRPNPWGCDRMGPRWIKFNHLLLWWSEAGRGDNSFLKPLMVQWVAWIGQKTPAKITPEISLSTVSGEPIDVTYTSVINHSIFIKWPQVKLLGLKRGVPTSQSVSPTTKTAWIGQKRPKSSPKHHV